MNSVEMSHTESIRNLANALRRLPNEIAETLVDAGTL